MAQDFFLGQRDGVLGVWIQPLDDWIPGPNAVGDHFGRPRLLTVV
jgi:hypothetical protein